MATRYRDLNTIKSRSLDTVYTIHCSTEGPDGLHIIELADSVSRDGPDMPINI